LIKSRRSCRPLPLTELSRLVSKVGCYANPPSPSAKLNLARRAPTTVGLF